MEIKKKYLSKYLHDIAIEQLEDEYLNKGYKINKEKIIGNYSADLIAQKDNEHIVIEVKTGKMSLEKKQKLAQIANYVKNLSGYKLLVVLATSPKEKKLTIENIEELLNDYLVNNFPLELNKLSTNLKVEKFLDIDIDEIKIVDDYINVKGVGVVTVDLLLESDFDQENELGTKLNENFPFDFELILEKHKENKFKIKEVINFKIDTSSYYD